MSDSSDSKWVVVIDGAVQDQKFDDEGAANKHAAKQRDNHGQKIVVFQQYSARHQKAFDAGHTQLDPKPESKAASRSDSKK